MAQRNRPASGEGESRFRSRAEREAILQRRVLRLVIGVSGALALILIVAFIYSQFIAPNEVIARVYDVEIRASEFQQRFVLERALVANQLNNFVAYYQQLGLSAEDIQQQLLNDPQVSAWQNELTIPDQLGIRVIRALAEEKLIRRVAGELGVTVGEAEIEAERASYFNFSEATATPALSATPTASPTASATPILSPTPSEIPSQTPTPASATPTELPPADATDIPPSATPAPTRTPVPTLTAAERRDNYETRQSEFDDYLRGQGARQSTIDAWHEARAWRTALAEARREAADETLYVALRHILVGATDIALAEELLAALAAGESFNALAREHSTDGGSAARGGFYDYAPVDPHITNFVPEFAAAALNAAVGETVGPVQTDFGYHLIQVLGRENRATNDGQRRAIQDGRFADYLESLVSEEESSGNYEVRDSWVRHLPGQ